MEASGMDNHFPDLFDIVKSWIPGRNMSEAGPTNSKRNPNPAPTSNPNNLPRDFWMPDQSCRVCYDCDSQFTLINRRHHCRICGRVFCSKCTAFVPRYPRSDQSEGERIRVCNFCLKQRQVALTGVSRNEDGVGCPMLSPTLSSVSMESSKTSSTGQTLSTLTGGSASVSNGNDQNCDCPPGDYAQLDRATATDACPEMEQFLEPGKIGKDTERVCEHYECSLNRSDDEDDDYSGFHSDSETIRCNNSDDYYTLVNIHNAHEPYQSDQVQVDLPTKQDPPFSPDHAESTAYSSSFNSDQTVERRGFTGDECPTNPSALYGIEHIEENTVDIENNWKLWVPPEPEDGEEGEVSFEDEDDAGPAGDDEWRYLRTNSFGGLFPSRERSAEEHKKVMKTVVDGHFRALICQLLKAENIPTGEGEEGSEGWLDIITQLGWDAASLLKPDMSKGEGMDPGGYVKVKCIACGRPSDSAVIKGVVCKKNVAHRRMATKIVKPRILILGGALEYQRVSNLLSSFDTLLQQEVEYLRMAVAKIQVHRPDVLLVEKAVARSAQDLFLNRNISLVLNIKRPLLERIARCTGAQIVPSIDHLSEPQLGQCELFHVEKFLEEHGSAGEEGKKGLKTLMFFEDCPRPFGCTILLKGASGNELKKVKHVIQYAVFAAYHLALETSFLADEGATLPELPLQTPLLVGLPEKPSVVERSIAVVKPNPSPQSQNEGGMMLSPFSESRSNSLFGFLSESFLPSPSHSVEKGQNGVVEKQHDSQNGVVEKQRDSLNVDVSRSTKNDNLLTKEDYLPSPSDHQSILVSLSSRCDWKKTACEGAHLLRIKFYGSCDKPLGRFLREQLFDQSYQCRFCEMPPEAHVYCYTHRQGSLTISVRKLPDHLPGESDGKIWMWHRCLKCPQVNKLPPANKRVVMSDAAWRLSFGKFLELSFSNHASASRVASCGHSLHRDCLRFYGFGRMVACFRYAPTKVHNVYLPPPKLDFGFLHQDWVEKEAAEVANSVELVFSEVSNALQRIKDKWPITGSLNGNENLLESMRNIHDLEMLLHSEKAEFEEMVLKLTKKKTKKGKSVVDILEVNKLKREILFLSYLWDQRLILAAGSTKDKGEPISSSSARLAEHRSDEPQSDDLDQGSLDGKRSKGNHGSSASLQGQPASVSLESGSIFRRVLSDGEFPLSADISDTLDAKWRGEGGKVLFEVATLAKTLPGLTDDKPKSLVKIPFLVFYDSLNKNPSGLARLNTLGEYIPIYVTSFRDLSRKQGARLFLPLGVNATVVPVFDDEPTSIISYALVSRDYHSNLSDEVMKSKEVVGIDPSVQLPVYDSGNFNPLQLMEDLSSDSFKSSSAEDPINSTKYHIKVSFEENGPLGKAKFTVLCYYAKCFEALRKKCCPSEVDFVRSLSRCKTWGAQGGKSNVFFAKSLDDRFIIKQVTKTELESFIKFAPDYFKYLSESISTGSPTCLAKILGIYQVTTKHVKGGKESKMDLLVMENLLFGRNVTRLYDLKGSSRSRYNSDSSGNNKVLLDQNLIEMMPTSPIFVGNKAKRVLERAIWNDTNFLASIDVMDYSLLVGVDEERQELVLGIIDFMRQYTWDKHLETWAKSSGILGGPKNASPTVVSPQQYKKRFRKAMSAYFIVVPDQWPPAVGTPNKSYSDLSQLEAKSSSQEPDDKS
ncbi:hypothetical protein LUZ61_020924 [Rhynchospora tenuis]|uniref:1-phosphatidylinositol-3-phosphate 5-kinase n=1 Tax=Rhynchospora tenuis TaxID=198213 RepID=A0AAD5ZEC6_9POAL|nr:hypothetical protein LUZ61_020924 [Rhynchospora tenuis]